MALTIMSFLVLAFAVLGAGASHTLLRKREYSESLQLTMTAAVLSCVLWVANLYIVFRGNADLVHVFLGSLLGLICGWHIADLIKYKKKVRQFG